MKKNLFLIGIVFALSGCSDKENIAELTGTYSGTFAYVNRTNPDAPHPSGSVSITFFGNNFTCMGGDQGFAQGGSGNFQVLNDQLVKFNDQNVRDTFNNWNRLLNGEYLYQVKGDSLILIKYFPPSPTIDREYPNFSTYEYRLKRISPSMNTN